MKTALSASLLSVIILACGYNKNQAQTSVMQSNDSLIQHINNSKGGTEFINPKLKQLQQENDLVISFGSLNYAWARRGSFYVLALQNKTWKLYRYDVKLPPSTSDSSIEISPLEVNNVEGEKIRRLYSNAQLWKTEGDNGENFCTGKKDCNINDAEAWTISVATHKNIHTTAYYAPEFYEECCPGNLYRKAFITIAKNMMQLAPHEAGGTQQ